MKKVLLCSLLLTLALTASACNNDPVETPTEVPTTAPIEVTTEAPTEEATTEEATTEAITEAATTEAVTEAATEEATAEATTAEETVAEETAAEETTAEDATVEEATTAEAVTEEVTTEAPVEETTEAPAPAVEPTAYFSAEDIAALTPTNATAVLEDGYVHFQTGVNDTITNPSINLVSEGEGFSDIIAIKYRTNCGGYGSNYWGTFLLNGTAEFQGNRYMSDNWFYYGSDGEWDVLVLDMRRNTAGSEGTPDTDVTDGAAIQSLIYNFFDYAGNGGKLDTADGGDEYFDIGYIAFFDSVDDAYEFANS